MVNAIRNQNADAADDAARAHAMQFKRRFMQYLDRGMTPEVRLNAPTSSVIGVK
jgi:DNA-binding GntR family transcriptional regulator